MAEALIKIKDFTNENNQPDVVFEVKFSPAIENESPAHQMVAEFIKFARLQEEKTIQTSE